MDKTKLQIKVTKKYKLDETLFMVEIDDLNYSTWKILYFMYIYIMGETSHCLKMNFMDKTTRWMQLTRLHDEKYDMDGIIFINENDHCLDNSNNICVIDFVNASQFHPHNMLH